ncbi:hypothetical protein OHA72_56645 [Dactylosporangium sp. NBC_01737]|uniref:hypothetical protein n=1 Tax=Dactylosporangium sp. NBC_01737 TaxID=2975959 RepID=UPI002E123C95|nr:hypothetical protein OHA72_56645 [Dactylosporangium sp. NBC_01737]
MTQLEFAGQPTVTGPHGTMLAPVAEHHADRSRPVGAFAIHTDGTVSFVPVTDPQRLAWCAVAGLAAAAAIAVAGAVRRGRGPSIGAVHMGPGGWVSLKGATPSRLLPARRPRRPWWARLLRAHRLVVE